MSRQAETEREERTPAGSLRPRDPDRLRADGGGGKLDVIACDGCGRSFATPDGPGMIALIKGACPDCGGRFRMTSETS